MKNRLPLFFIAALLSVLPTILLGQSQYNIYFGDIHSHTWYSDGNKDQDTNTYKKPVAKAITYARTVANNMNYLGVSEHNHNESLNMKMGYWRSGNLEADSVNQNGTFVGMYGQEWGTISGGGHILIYGTNKLFGWNPGLYDSYVAKGDYTALYDSVKKYNGFMYLAHPNSTDFDGYFSSYHANWDPVVSGIAVKSGPALDAIYNESDNTTSNYEGLYHTALRLGYHVAPCGNQDNHYTNFGMLSQVRTGVLATSLTQANILDGLRNRHAYTTEDHDLQVRFESGTHIMGDIYTINGNVPLRVKVTDPSNTITSIVIRYGIPGSASTAGTLTSVANVDSLIFSQNQANDTTYYYYAYVTNNANRHAWSAPIWVRRTSGTPPSAFDLSTPANSSANRPVSGTISWSAASGATGYDVYLGTSSPGSLVSTNQAGTSYSYSSLPNNTTYFWKAVAKNSFGSTTASSAPWSFTTVVAAPTAFTLTSPVSGTTNQAVSGTLNWSASSGATGYDVYLDGSNPPTTIVSVNQPGTTYNYAGLSSSTQYYWKVVAKNIGGSTTSSASPWNFTTIAGAPASFTQASPSAGATNQAVSGTLSWNVSANATSYDVYLDANPNPTTLVSADQAGTSYNYAGLTNNVTYYWKIVAKNISATQAASNAPMSFTTIVSSPGAFSLLSPLNGANGVSRSGKLTWAPAPWATSYDVYMDTIGAVTIVAGDVTDTSYDYVDSPPNFGWDWKVVAKNVAGNITASGAPYSFVTNGAPLAASALVTSNVTATSAQLDWQDNATDETGYRVYRATALAGPYSQVGSDLPSNTVTYTETGLPVNQRHYYRVVPFNGAGESTPAEANCLTLAVPPGTPLLADTSYDGFRVTLDPATNPAGTEFTIAVVDDPTVYWVQADGSLGATPVWRTYAQWGGATGIVLSGVPHCQTYAVSATSRNLDGVEGGVSTEAHVTLLCFSLSSNVQTGWNIVSLPLNMADQSKNAVFPTSTSQAFGYQSGYVPSDTLRLGHGYWLKFAGADPVSLNGAPAYADTIPLVAGWNIVGSVASPVDAGIAFSTPPGILTTPFYGYNGAYFVADTIQPLAGYWVKANAPGQLVVSSLLAAPSKAAARPAAEEAPSLGTLLFADVQGRHQLLTLLAKESGAAELPPTPPAGTFDVRFANQKLAAPVAGGEELPVVIQATAPVDLSWDLMKASGASLELVFGTTVLPVGGTGSVRLPDGTTEVIVRGRKAEAAVPASFALHQNYPNPFNPSTEIRYDLPVRSAVRMTVYSILGTPVATLVDGEQAPGYHSVTWRPNLASGVYLYRLEAVSLENPTVTFQKMSRMLLLR